MSTDSNASPSDENYGRNFSDVSQEVRKNPSTEERITTELWKPIALTSIYIYALTLFTQGWPKDQSTFSHCSVWAPLAASVLYLTAIFLGTKFMKNREAYSAKNYMFTYNLYQTILNGWCVYAFLEEIVRNGYPVWGNTLSSTSFKMSFLIWLHYNNKYVELLDTAFMVVRKKNDQLSFLHVYHHVLLIWAWWFVCHYACGGDAYFGAMMNSFIHVVMYSYYLMSSLGISCPWKKYITQMQMVQFVICFGNAVFNAVTGGYPFWLCMIQVYVMLNMLVLFANFYKKAYSPGRVPKKVEEKIN